MILSKQELIDQNNRLINIYDKLVRDPETSFLKRLSLYWEILRIWNLNQEIANGPREQYEIKNISISSKMNQNKWEKQYE